jgi:hypothetical protein
MSRDLPPSLPLSPIPTKPPLRMLLPPRVPRISPVYLAVLLLVASSAAAAAAPRVVTADTHAACDACRTLVERFTVGWEVVIRYRFIVNRKPVQSCGRKRGPRDWLGVSVAQGAGARRKSRKQGQHSSNHVQPGHRRLSARVLQQRLPRPPLL